MPRAGQRSSATQRELHIKNKRRGGRPCKTSGEKKKDPARSDHGQHEPRRVDMTISSIVDRFASCKLHRIKKKKKIVDIGGCDNGEAQDHTTNRAWAVPPVLGCVAKPLGDELENLPPTSPSGVGVTRGHAKNGRETPSGMWLGVWFRTATYHKKPCRCDPLKLHRNSNNPRQQPPQQRGRGK